MSLFLYTCLFLLISAQVGLPSGGKSEGTAGIVSLHGKLFARMENKKKTKAKIYCQANKEKIPRKLQEYYRNLCEDEKIKKRNYANLRKKFVWAAVRERKMVYMKNYYYEGKKC